jgi:hypothetical protein
MLEMVVCSTNVKPERVGTIKSSAKYYMWKLRSDNCRIVYWNNPVSERAVA